MFVFESSGEEHHLFLWSMFHCHVSLPSVSDLDSSVTDRRDLPSQFSHLIYFCCSTWLYCTFSDCPCFLRDSVKVYMSYATCPYMFQNICNMHVLVNNQWYTELYIPNNFSPFKYSQLFMNKTLFTKRRLLFILMILFLIFPDISCVFPSFSAETLWGSWLPRVSHGVCHEGTATGARVRSASSPWRRTCPRR